MIRDYLDEDIHGFEEEIRLQKEQLDETDQSEDTKGLLTSIQRSEFALNALKSLRSHAGHGTFVEFNIRPLAVDIKYQKLHDEHGNLANLHVIQDLIMERVVRSVLRDLQEDVQLILHDKDGPCLYLNEYLHDKAYGGSEEGGWWYNTGEFIKCHGVIPGVVYEVTDALGASSGQHYVPPTYTDAFKTLSERREHLQKEIDRELNDPRGSKADPSSVASEGRHVLQIDTHPGENYPKRRPHYE